VLQFLLAIATGLTVYWIAARDQVEVSNQLLAIKWRTGLRLSSAILIALFGLPALLAQPIDANSPYVRVSPRWS
jgi:hypothetical protein